MLTYRELHTNQELTAVFELEQVVWGMPPGEAVPTSILSSVIHNGGGLIGAYDDNQLIGFVFGMPARHDADWWLWSYMAGVAPGYQSQGVGVGLKQSQRTWALANGYDIIKWTFDPLQRANANFNFNKLGVIAHTYHINLYGDLTDAINVGLQSDRFEVTWRLNDERVIALANQSPLPPSTNVIRRIEIPYNLSELKQRDLNAAQQWQLEFRAAMLAAFAEGLTVTQFMVEAERCYYCLF